MNTVSGQNSASERDRRLAELLQVALGVPPDARESELRSASDDEALIREVLELIHEDSAELDSLSGSPLPALDALQADEEVIGSTIGPYVIEEKIGQGGMGVVYAARQTEPVERRVAIKLASSHLVRPRDRARFHAERRALARLTHPNIAQLYEAGVTPTGRPYVVMELVEGEPITDFCDRRRLGLRERLRLLGDVCAAVEHAHNRQILHRDLKPPNVLVSQIGDRAVAKVIDFGIAAVLDADEDTAPVSGVVGTPAYLSPEAIRGEPLDSRADVYSLGVILYELLCDQPPVPRSERSLAALLAAQTGGDPERPSALLTADGLVDEAAGRRDTSARVLLTDLRRDLDWVARRAVARDPEARYPSPRDLAADLARFLEDRPVQARSHDGAYVLRKFVRRHRGGTWAAVATAALLIAALTFGIRYTLDVQRARNQADAARQQAEGLVNFLLDDLYGELDSSASRRVLQTVAERANEYFEGLPEPLAVASATRHARALRNLARVHLEQGEYQQAQERIEAAFALDRGALARSGAGSRSTLEGLAGDHRGMGDVMARFGRREEALDHVREAVALRRRVLEIAPDSSKARAELAYDLGELGWALRNKAELVESADAFAEATQVLEQIQGIDSSVEWKRLLLSAYRERGGAMRMAYGPGQGLADNRRSVEIAEELLEQTPEDTELLLDAGASWIALSLQQRETGALTEAVRSNRTGVERITRWTRIDPDSTYAREYLAYGHLQLAWSLSALQEDEQARAQQLRVVELTRNLPDTLSAKVLEAEALLLLGRVDEAVPIVPRLIEAELLANRPQLTELIEAAGLLPGR